MNGYTGKRLESGCVVTVDGKPLSPRLDLFNHSPSGFEWAYQGSGPAQLALAILAHHLGDDDRAVKLHQDFKRAVVAGLPHDGWHLDKKDVDAAIEYLEGAP